MARLVYPDGRPQTCVGDLPTLGEALVGRSLSRRVWSRSDAGGEGRRGFWWYDWAHDEECPVGHGGEACYLVRRAALAEIGLQDEGFPLDWEGIEWSARTYESGWEVWFCPEAIATHIGGASLKQAPYRWVVSSHLGAYRYFRSRLPAAARPLLAGVLALRATFKLGARAAGLRVYDRARPRSRA